MASRRGVAFALLALLTFAAFAPLLRSGFVNYDDDRYVYENPRVRAGLSLSGVRWALTTFEQANWHPLTWLSHMSDVSLFGLFPAAHHGVSLLVHVVAALALLAVLEALTGELWKSALVAALFAVHPLHVESVAWVAERKDLLSGLLGIATLHAWLGHLRRPGAGRYLAALGCLALGLAAKPMLVTLPLLLLLLDRWPLGRWRRGVPPPRLLLEKAPLFALALASGIVTLVAQRRGGALKTAVEYPLGARLANALDSGVAYLVQALWPRGLAVFYPHPGEGADLVVAAAAGALLAALTILLVRRSPTHPAPAIGWGWFLLMLAPVIGLVQVGAQARADRYTYLPLIGVFVAVVWGVPPLLPATRRQRAVLGMAAAVAVAAALAFTRAQVPVWHDSVSLFEHALAVTRGNYVAHDNLAIALADAGRMREGLPHALEALRLKPDRPERYLSLAREFSREGQAEQAVETLALAVARHPGFAEGHYALGLAFQSRGRAREAQAHLAAAVALAPSVERYRATLEAANR